MEYDIKELYPSALHAYTSIQLAVKTSRPHEVMLYKEHNFAFLDVTPIHRGRAICCIPEVSGDATAIPNARCKYISKIKPKKMLQKILVTITFETPLK